MTLSLGEHGVTLHLIADRAETLDLLRRHIGLLGEEFARLGYASADFSFGSGPGGDQQAASADTGAEPTAAPAAMPALAQTNAVAPGTAPRRTGLDLRL
ncbi:MAG: hypothetical protein CVT80_04715 [Alphaproteobacteria bacterium HGW-Alphaproteobacteria-2]|nr:MAG: hypothetical protein CVT80_04715 [Alphaproteobacteria bacterium HGW-Alphaproteobacteria-2]